MQIFVIGTTISLYVSSEIYMYCIKQIFCSADLSSNLYLFGFFLFYSKGEEVYISLTRKKKHEGNIEDIIF